VGVPAPTFRLFNNLWVPLKGVVLNLRHLYFDIVSDFDIRISCFDDLSSTPVENVRQIGLFLQNKANLWDTQIGLSSASTMAYGNVPPSGGAKTKPIQSQFWPKNQGVKPNQTQFQK